MQNDTVTYLFWLADWKKRIQSAQIKAALRVNPQGWQASMLLSSFYAQRDRLDDARVL